MTNVTVQYLDLFNNHTHNRSKGIYEWNQVHITELDQMMASTLLPVVVYVAILMVLGIIGNIIVCYIYIFRWKRKTIRYFIGSLAAYDFVTSVVCMPIEMAMLRNPVTLNDPNLCKFQRFMRSMTSLGAGFMLVVIAVDRYLRICKLSKSQIQFPLAKKLCVTSGGFGLVFSWPCLVLFGQINRSESPIAETSCFIDRAFNGTPYPTVYYTVVSLFFLVISVCLLTFYSLILTKLCKMPVLTKAKTLNSRNEISTTGNISSSSSDDFPDNSTKLNTKLPTDCSKSQMTTEFCNNELSPRGKMSLSDGKLFRFSPKREPFIPIRMKRTSFLLFLVTASEWLSFLPYFALLSVTTFNKDFLQTLSETEQVVYNIGIVTHYLSSGINPYMYGFFSREFRKECKKTILSIKNLLWK